jgi:hypothetical protein
MNETLAYGLIGNSVPVATMGAFCVRQAVEAVLKVLPAAEVASAEAREEAAVIQTKLDKLRLPTYGRGVQSTKEGLRGSCSWVAAYLERPTPSVARQRWSS